MIMSIFKLPDKEAAALAEQPDEATEATFDAILEKAGGMGKWQWSVFSIAAVGTVFNALATLGVVFLAITPDHWCRVPGLPTNLTWSEEEIKRYALPREEKHGSLQYSSCHYYARNYSLAAMLDSGPVAPNATIPTLTCHQRKFDTSEYQSTMVTEWDLVCESQPLVATIQAVYMFGTLVGVVVSSSLSDRFGRRRATLLSLALLLVANFMVAFSPSYAVLIVFRFLAALGMPGNYTCPYVVVTEITASTRYRAFFGAIYNIPFAIGYMILPAIAYYVRGWSNLQLTVSVPAVILIAEYWFLPESPRWLASRGHFVEALKVLKRGARLNGRTLPPDDDILLDMRAFKEKEDMRNLETQQNRRYLVIQLCAMTGVRNLTCIAFFTWFVVSMVYYGLALNAPMLSSNMYLVFFLGGVVEIPAYIITCCLVRFVGRRPSYSGTFLLGGAACLATLIDAPGAPWLRPALALIGKCLITITFTLSYLYTVELFPTVLRNVAIGLGSMFARIGSIAAPYVVDLLGAYHETIPLLIFGSLAIAAGLSALLLPETSEANLPETFASVRCSFINRCKQEKPPIIRLQEEIGLEQTEANGHLLQNGHHVNTSTQRSNDKHLQS